MLASRLPAYAFFVALAFACRASDAESIATPAGLDRLVRNLHAVVWVQLSDKRPVEFTFDRKVLMCGHLYTATVVESARSGLDAGETFDFFSEYDAALDRGDRDYLAVVNRTDPTLIPDYLHRADRSLKGLDAELAKCRARAMARADYQVFAANTVMIAPAVAALADRPGGPWFERNASNFLSEPEFAFISYEVDGETRSATSWAEIKRVLPPPKRRHGLPDQ